MGQWGREKIWSRGVDGFWGRGREVYVTVGGFHGPMGGLMGSGVRGPEVVLGLFGNWSLWVLVVMGNRGRKNVPRESFQFVRGNFFPKTISF